MTADEFLERGQTALEAGDRDAALADFTEALRLDPGDPAALLARGNLFSDLGRFKEAAADFRKALKREKDHVAGMRYNLGNALYNLGQHAKALAEYDKSVGADPNFGWAHHGRSISLSALGRHEEALAAVDEAVRLMPDHPMPVGSRAVSLAQLGRHDEALAAFAEAIRINPRFATAYRNRAVLHSQMGHADLAAADRAAAEWCEEKATLEPGKLVLRPTEKMKRLYRRFSELCGGEPEDLWTFDPLDFAAPPPPFLGITHVMAWPADANCDVTSFLSLGMSDRRMVGADYFSEIHFAIRAPLDEQQRLEVARRIADLVAYPFQYDRKLDWWELIRDPGRLPGFTGCKHLLLHPRLTEEGFDVVEDSEGVVKILMAIPITPHERQLILEHGRDALLDYLASNKIDVLSDRTDPEPVSEPAKRGGRRPRRPRPRS
jgi:Flp pilus assembly protein TadD